MSTSQRGRDEGYALAIEKALEQIRGADPLQRARAAGIEIVQAGGALRFRISCLARYRLLDPATGDILPDPRHAAGPAPPFSIQERVLIARYVARAVAREPAGRWIGFREIPGGAFYWPAFQARTGYLAARARRRGGKLTAQALALGGGELSIGDRGIWAPILPRVPAALVLWQGGDEFPPSEGLLFDETVSAHLEAEDVAVAAELFLKRLGA